MVEEFYVFGNPNVTATWRIGSNTPKGLLDEEFIGPKHSSFALARKWLLKELKQRRDEIGKVMEKWYRTKEE